MLKSSITKRDTNSGEELERCEDSDGESLDGGEEGAERERVSLRSFNSKLILRRSAALYFQYVLLH